MNILTEYKLTRREYRIEIYHHKCRPTSVRRIACPNDMPMDQVIAIIEDHHRIWHSK